ncbi:MAG: N-acetyltransferase [bacterium]|nr:N-acetyltransferase [bacterium]
MKEFTNTLEDFQEEGVKMPKEQGIHKVSVEENIDELFALDSKVAEASPHLLPLETPEELSDFLTKEHQSDTYIFNNEEGLAGYLSVIDIPDENALEVLNIGVDPKFQGEGYGKKMMLFAEEIAKENKKQKMKLVTNVKNDPAVQFYKRLGYAVIKEAENYYGDGETRYILEKNLDV